MGQVRWTHEAARWLEDIHGYIALSNPSAARKTVEGIYRLASTLSSFPKRGYRLEEREEREIRVVLYGHYRIAYLLRPAGDVDILGIFHGALDMGRYLSDLPGLP